MQVDEGWMFPPCDLGVLPATHGDGSLWLGGTREKTHDEGSRMLQNQSGVGKTTWYYVYSPHTPEQGSKVGSSQYPSDYQDHVPSPQAIFLLLIYRLGY